MDEGRLEDGRASDQKTEGKEIEIRKEERGEGRGTMDDGRRTTEDRGTIDDGRQRTEGKDDGRRMTEDRGTIDDGRQTMEERRKIDMLFRPSSKRSGRPSSIGHFSAALLLPGRRTTGRSQ